MKRKNVLAHRRGLLLIAAVILLTGCSRQQDSAETEVQASNQTVEETSSESEKEEQESSSTKTHLVQEGDGVLKVDATIEMPEQGLENIGKLTAQCREWNDEEKESIAKVLIPDVEVDAWTQDEQGDWNYQSDIENGRIDASFYYMKSTYDKKSYYGPMILEDFSDTYFDQEKDLGFLSVEEAKRQAEDFLKSLGINQVEIKRVYSVDHEKLNNRVAERAAEEGNQLFDEKAGLSSSDHWTEEDEYYLMEVVTGIDGIEVKEFGYMRQDYVSIPGSGIALAIGKDGVEYLETNAVYEKLEEEKVGLQNPEQILEKVREKFELLILDFEVLVKQMKVIYYPILQDMEEGKVTLQPVWEVQMEIEGNDVSYCFDGETGKELVQ